MMDELPTIEIEQVVCPRCNCDPDDLWQAPKGSRWAKYKVCSECYDEIEEHWNGE
jgi:hypothetical protein